MSKDRSRGEDGAGVYSFARGATATESHARRKRHANVVGCRTHRKQQRTAAVEFRRAATVLNVTTKEGVKDELGQAAVATNRGDAAANMGATTSVDGQARSKSPAMRARLEQLAMRAGGMSECKNGRG